MFKAGELVIFNNQLFKVVRDTGNFNYVGTTTIMQGRLIGRDFKVLRVSTEQLTRFDSLTKIEQLMYGEY